MKKLWIFLIVLLLCLAAIVGYFMINYKNHTASLEKEVVAYVDAKFPNSSLKETTSGYSLKGKGYYVDVIYSDEPNIRYTYMKIDNKIKLYGTTNPEGKHMDPSFDN